MLIYSQTSKILFWRQGNMISRSKNAALLNDEDVFLPSVPLFFSSSPSSSALSASSSSVPHDFVCSYFCSSATRRRRRTPLSLGTHTSSFSRSLSPERAMGCLLQRNHLLLRRAISLQKQPFNNRNCPKRPTNNTNDTS